MDVDLGALQKTWDVNLLGPLLWARWCDGQCRVCGRTQAEFHHRRLQHLQGGCRPSHPAACL
jgi:hypothetical protein